MEWFDTVVLNRLFTTTVTLAEIRHGILLQQDAESAHLLTLWLTNAVRPWFEDRIVEIGENEFVRWRILMRSLQLRKLPAPATDLLIAATALEHSMAVATRDVRPFVGTGVPVLNPWTGERFNGA